MAVCSRHISRSPRSSGRSSACASPVEVAVWRMRSTSAKSAGSSKALDAPWLSRRSRRRARTRSCSSAITLSTETSVAKLVADAGPYLDVAAAGRDHTVALLEAEEHLPRARLAEHMLD